VIIEGNGMKRMGVLQTIIDKKKARTYLEIGVNR